MWKGWEEKLIERREYVVRKGNERVKTQEKDKGKTSTQTTTTSKPAFAHILKYVFIHILTVIIYIWTC